MSASALTQAVRDAIIAAVQINGQPIDTNTCEVGFDGSVKPGAGQVYFAVHWGGQKNQSGDNDISELHDVAVTITRRLGDTPKDRYGPAVWLVTGGLDTLCRQIGLLVHKNQAVRLAANALIGNNAAGFHTALWWTGVGAPTFRDYRWFTGKLPPGTDKEAAQAGVSQTITFSRAERCQGLDGSQGTPT